MAYMRMGDLLISVGLITEEQLTQALQAQKGSGKRLGTVLIELGFISEKQLIETLELQLGISFIDLSKVNIPIEMAQLVPKNIAKRHSVVPVSLNRDELTLAMADPMNFMALEEVRAATRKRIMPRIATTEAVERAIATLYGNEGAARAIEEMKGSLARDRDATPEVNAGEELESDGQSAPTVRLVNSIVERSVIERASDIHLEPQETGMEVRIRVDGMLRHILTVPPDLQSSVISRIKIMGNMDIAERRVPQDGRANVRVKGTDIDLRISTLPTIYGERIVIRLLNKAGTLLSASAIGLEGDNLDKYNSLLQNASGVVLIVGPTGSGKSSTMYTMIRTMNKKETNLITLEDPVEYNIAGINQVQINEKTGMTFASGLRAILRQDPDVVAVGEIRDGVTAEIAMRAAITGHVVLSTIHTNDAVSTIDRLLDIGVEPYLIAEALKGVISQRLVRRICPECKQAYEPTDEDLEALGIERTPGLKFYKGKGCSNCYHTGYKGRTGVFEIMVLKKDAKRIIAEGRPRSELMEVLNREGFTTLRESCAKLVREGVTTASEMLRTVSSAED